MKRFPHHWLQEKPWYMHPGLINWREILFLRLFRFFSPSQTFAHSSHNQKKQSHNLYSVHLFSKCIVHAILVHPACLHRFLKLHFLVKIAGQLFFEGLFHWDGFCGGITAQNSGPLPQSLLKVLLKALCSQTGAYFFLCCVSCMQPLWKAEVFHLVPTSTWPLPVISKALTVPKDNLHLWGLKWAKFIQLLIVVVLPGITIKWRYPLRVIACLQ